MIIFVVIGILGVLIFLAPAAAIIGVLGMAPTLVYWLVDAHAFRALRLRTLFFFNLAGVIPEVVSNMGKNATMVIQQVIGDATSLLMMMSGAAIGLVVLGIAPPIAAFVMQAMGAEKARKYEKQQMKLIEVWGKEVAGNNTELLQQTQPTRPKDGRA